MARPIPFWVKLAYTAFMAVMVPVYLRDYGWTNFLYFCDVAALMTLVAVWRESALWASMPALGIMVAQAVWIVDFVGTALGHPVVGMTGYMFDPGIPLLTRGLSYYHFWLPLFVLWLLARLGYDRRAFWPWTVLAWGLALVCFFLMPAPPRSAEDPRRPVNINCVFGFSNEKPQEWMAPGLYFAGVLAVLPLGIFLPTHLVLRAVFRKPAIRPITGRLDPPLQTA